ncbi:hypothetical protein BFW38_09900 [Terasakiispira papahanaumokuakeensis]|uniref:DUF3135 domain-containing protein n=1 Tax=Terasakiispira papahanaumokuakeensis TaxID=197479 RepID=A0A1E2VA07_9GAMM|nr:DUF3135 domain-containing protein [Terasakiispira papahanaumokuakeensis]ODC03807.1 hypothetical protein BFW38_09900 [Terasakiispira papahanaumokuakeensis]
MATSLPCFDTLMEMAQQDPQALEALRQKLSDEIVEQSNQKQRRKLEQLRFRIEGERYRATTPLASCIRLSSLMHDTLYHLNIHLEKLQQPISSFGPVAKPPTPSTTLSKTQNQSAKILPFVTRY